MIKEPNGSLAASAADQRRRVSFSNRGILIGAIPRPVSFVGWDSLEISLLAVKAPILNEKPDLPFQNIVDLLRLMSVRLGVVSGRAHCDHQAALIAVAFFHNHGTFPRCPLLHPLSPRNFFILRVKPHFISPY
jgi:hypothetical protein